MIGQAKPRSFSVVSAEDIILYKIKWYDISGGVSRQQWDDVQAVLKAQAGNLDKLYLGKWARQVGILSLVTQAIREAGV